MTASTVSLINPTLCQHNKFQPLSRRTFTDDELSDLRNIIERGLDYPIKVYRNGDNPNSTEALSFIVKDGWRRVSAWLMWKPGELIPASIETPPADDRELFTTTVLTNESRENLNVIQKADLLAQAIKLGMTQAEAGRLFNPPIGQTAVSHVLSLRKLPDEIKCHIENGNLPERSARSLVTLSKHAPDQAIQAAHKIAQAKPEQKDYETRVATREAYSRAGIRIHEQYAFYKWPEKETDVSAEAKSDKGEPSTIATCHDCPFNIEFSSERYCMRPACYRLKTRLMQARQQKKADEQAASKPVQPSQKKQPKPSEASIRAAVAKGQALAAEAKAKREADLTECRRLIAAALNTLVGQMPILPEPYLTLIAKDLSNDFTCFETEDAPKWLSSLEITKNRESLKPAERRRLVSGAIITARLDDCWNMTPASVKKAAEATAKEWKLKLPKNWDAPAAVPPPSPKEKKGYEK